MVDDRSNRSNQSNRNSRIDRLSQRFTKHALGHQRMSERNRERKSFYLDADLVTRMVRVFHEINHAIYPKRVSKSIFLELIIEKGIENKAELQNSLSALAENEDLSDE